MLDKFWLDKLIDSSELAMADLLVKQAGLQTFELILQTLYFSYPLLIQILWYAGQMRVVRCNISVKPKSKSNQKYATNFL